MYITPLTIEFFEKVNSLIQFHFLQILEALFENSFLRKQWVSFAFLNLFFLFHYLFLSFSLTANSSYPSLLSGSCSGKHRICTNRSTQLCMGRTKCPGMFNSKTGILDHFSQQNFKNICYISVLPYISVIVFNIDI